MIGWVIATQSKLNVTNNYLKNVTHLHCGQREREKEEESEERWRETGREGLCLELKGTYSLGKHQILSEEEKVEDACIIQTRSVFQV